jgi:hypothetical protein
MKTCAGVEVQLSHSYYFQLSYVSFRSSLLYSSNNGTNAITIMTSKYWVIWMCAEASTILRAVAVDFFFKV